MSDEYLNILKDSLEAPTTLLARECHISTRFPYTMKLVVETTRKENNVQIKNPVLYGRSIRLKTSSH